MNSGQNHKTRTLWLVGALHAFTHVYHVALMPLYLLIQRDFKLESVAAATLLLTVMMASYFLPSYPMGILADRMNRKQLLGWGLAINALGFAGLALAPNYPCALAAMIVAGFGGSFYHPSATAMIARLFPVGTGKALGLAGIGASAGFFLGPIFTGWRADALEPVLGAAAWRRPVLELGVLGLVAAGLFARFAQNEESPSSIPRNPGHTEKVFPTPALFVLFLLCAFAFSLRDFAGTSMGSLGSLFLQKAHGYDTKWTGVALSGIFFAGAISNPLFGHLSDRGRKRWMALALTMTTIMVAVFPHVPKGWTIPTFVVYGFFFLASYPMVEAALMESVPDAVRGRAFGLFITVGGLIGNLSHWIVGNEVKRMGDTAQMTSSYFLLYAAMAMLMALSLLGVPCLHAIRKREHLEAPPDLQSTAIAKQPSPIP